MVVIDLEWDARERKGKVQPRGDFVKRNGVGYDLL